MTTVDIDHLKKLKQAHVRTLQVLELKEAEYGRLNCPPHIILEIEDITEKISNIDEEIQRKQYSPNDTPQGKSIGSNKIDDLVTERLNHQVNNALEFTAYDITLSLRKHNPNFSIDHDYVRHSVHLQMRLIVKIGLYKVEVRNYGDFKARRYIPQTSKQSTSNVTTFYKIPLPDSHSFDLPGGNPNPPLDYTFSGVQFNFRSNKEDNRPVGIQIPYSDEVTIGVDIPRAKSIFILLNAEYGFKDLGNGVAGHHRQIGEITLNFTDKPKIIEPLILGVNIRDWCYTYSKAITNWETGHTAVEAWRGPGERGLIIDMLDIDWDKPAHLRSINIRNHLKSEIVPKDKPGILIWAITCKVI